MKALLIDDDPMALDFLEWTLSSAFPRLEITRRETPDVSGEFDLYVLDNEFNGRPLAAELARQVRATAPGALVLAYSAHLDAGTLKALLAQGCSGACDKSDPSDMESALEVIDAYLNTSTRARPTAPAKGLLGAVRSVTQLLSSWNQRLDSSEQVA